MALPWVRLDANIASHDKILELLGKKPPALAYQAAFSYVCSIAYCGGHETDGVISFAALGFVHCTRKAAELLVEVGLWEPAPTGWKVHNYELRQQLAVVSEMKRVSKSMLGRKAACARHHGKECGCWQEAQ